MAHRKLKSKTLFSFSALFFFFFLFISVHSTEPSDAAYMSKLLNALTWTPSSWSNSTHMCQWSGVSCDKHGRVEKIHFNSMSLAGTLPSGLNSLSLLNFLDLRNNFLTGPFPSLANLTFLKQVYLDNNNFTSVPEGCFHGLTSFRTLTLSNNVNLTPWNFPADLTPSYQLQYLDLTATNLMGSLPNISHYFPSLQALYISDNNLSSIPDGCFQNLTSLAVLSLSNNANLAPWTFPPDLTHSSQLASLDLEATNLKGSLPNLSHFFPNLSDVNLSKNNLTSIPDGCFQGLTRLQLLHLGNNANLAQWAFPNLTQSSPLKELNLVTTNVTGSLPEIFNFLPRLQTVLLSNNNLTGVLPKSFAGSKVAKLRLNDQQANGLSGTIEILSSMMDLSEVWLQGNSFEGPIPDLSRCTSLQDLHLECNRLTGVVPHSLMSLWNLKFVFLNNNFLQGPVPKFDILFGFISLGNNTTNGFCRRVPGPCDRRVTILLEIAGNFGYPSLLARSWQGNYPCQNWSFIACVGGKITTVDLRRRNLTGTISPAFGDLTHLENLYLGGNNLSGSIPKSLTNLLQLKNLDVSNNNLSGSIPIFSPTVNLTTTGNLLLRGTNPSAWIAVASAAGGGAIAIVVVVICLRKRCLSLVQMIVFKKPARTFVDNKFEDFIKSYGSLMLKRYNYLEVKRMTNSFRDKLGQGGYGIVYRASLSDGRQVAVKALTESKGSGEEFINEVASISRTSHVNIVSLLGFCYEKNKRALIYEFMSNGSLDKFIYKKGSPNAVCDLDWNTLSQITIGIARGLEYLHRGCNTRILHLDIKPQNILLDEDFCPKIADFGLAKICKKKESIVSILGPRGTPGYIAPEVFSRIFGGVSHKSDVYSYGMLILEVVGGRKNYDTEGSHTSDMYFPDWIYRDLEQGNILARCSSNTKEENEMIMKITLVSLWCIQPNPSDRPSMTKVVEMLEGPYQSVPYPPKPVLYSSERSHLQLSNICYSSIHETELESIK